MKRQKLLVLGIPRSGTTLLNTLIGAHSKAAMLNEDLSGAIRNLVSKKIVGNKLCIPNHIGFGAPLLHRISRRYGYYVFKDRSAISLNEYLDDPSLKLMVILRDPRASINSMMQRGNLPFDEAGQRWAQGTEMAFRLYDQECSRLQLLTFEALVQEPERVLKGLCDFLDLSYQPRMLQGWKSYPYSDHGGIRAEKATAGNQADLPAGVRPTFPEVFAMHETLCDLALT